MSSTHVASQCRIERAIFGFLRAVVVLINQRRSSVLDNDSRDLEFSTSVNYEMTAASYEGRFDCRNSERQASLLYSTPTLSEWQMHAVARTI